MYKYGRASILGVRDRSEAVACVARHHHLHVLEPVVALRNLIVAQLEAAGAVVVVERAREHHAKVRDLALHDGVFHGGVVLPVVRKRLLITDLTIFVFS